MASALRSFAVISLASVLGLLFVPACSQQSEGERCEMDSDCDSDLSCVSGSDLLVPGTDRCCPEAGTESDERCTRESSSGGGTSNGGTSNGGTSNGGTSAAGAAGESAGGNPSGGAGGEPGAVGGEPGVGGADTAEGGMSGSAGAPSAAGMPAGGAGGSE